MNKYHHGYLLVGDANEAKEAALKMASEILGREKNSLASHPDFLFIAQNPLTIDESRNIREKSSKKSFSGQGRIFVIQTNFFTKEAINALLKTLEEPAGLSYFFIITSSEENVLETLRSRLVVLKFERGKELSKDQRDFIVKFLQNPIDKRTELIKKMSSEKEKTLKFLDEIEVILREKLLADFSRKILNALEDLNTQRQYIFQRSTSLKMILEHLCLVLPQF